MAKVIALGLFVLITGVVAEPPVGYLPPQAQRSSPANVYGAPLAGSAAGKATSSFHSRSGSTSVSYSALHDEQASQKEAIAFGGFGSNTGAFRSVNGVSHMQVRPNAEGHHFGTSFGSSPAFGISQQYAAPADGAVNAAGSVFGNSFGAVGPSPSFSLSQQYGVPHAGSAGRYTAAAASGGAFGNTRLNAFSGSSSFGANRFGNSLQRYKASVAGAGSFGTTSGSYSGSARLSSSAFRNGIQGSLQYGVPAAGSNGASFKSRPAASSGAFFESSAGSPAGNSFGSLSSKNALDVFRQYGAPAFGAGADADVGNRFGANFPVYRVPNNAPYSAAQEQQLEPANYEYNYEVQAADVSGVQFGHQETREDEDAKGAYHVLLPDGRTQVVEYQANEGGYQPKIRYEEPASGRAHAGGLSGPY